MDSHVASMTRVTLGYWDANSLRLATGKRLDINRQWILKIGRSELALVRRDR